MSDTWSVFDIIGPIMVGPSSSHTAGACKLGIMARYIFGKTPKIVHIELHGSFGDVKEGHCTDLAIVGGLLGMLPSNKNICTSDERAKEEGMEYSFQANNLGDDQHPNTVRFTLQADDRTQVITGCSVGGGKAIITEIDKIPVYLTGNYSSLLVCFDNTNFSLNTLLQHIAQKNITIVNTETTIYKNRTLADIEIKEYFYPKTVQEISTLNGVEWARYINHFSHYPQ